MSLPSELLPVGLLGTGAAAAAEEYTISRSLRFNSADSANLSRDMTTASSTYTFSAWVKLSQVSGGTYQYIFGSGRGGLAYHINKTLYVFDNSTLQETTALFRDPSAWYHIVFSVNSLSFTLYVNNVSVKTGSAIALSTTAGATRIGAYNGTGSPIYFFNGYLADVHFIDGQALDPTSFGEFDATTGVWNPIAYTGSFPGNSFHLDFADNSTAAALGTDTSGNGNTWTVNNISVQAGNGNYITNLYTSSTSTYDGSATDTNLYNGGVGTRINGFDGNLSTIVHSADVSAGWLYFRPSVALSSVTQLRVYADYVQEIRINGTVATVSPSLPAISTQWYTITSPPSTITEIAIQGSISASATARFRAIEVNNIVLVDYRAGAGNDSLVDSPTNYGTDTGAGGEVRGNYAIWNPLNNGGHTLSNGNLDYDTSAAGYKITTSTVGMSSGKWYCEVDFTATPNATIGLVKNGATLTSYVGADANGWGVLGNSGSKVTNASQTSYTTSWTAAVISIAFDADAGTLVFYKDGTSLGTAFTGLTSGPYFFAVGGSSGGSSATNFGQRAFASAPSGYTALCTQNLTAPAIENGSTAMDVVTYTGNGSTKTISGLNFSPDLVWGKIRSTTSFHRLHDSVRGSDNTLTSSGTSAEVVGNGIVSFTSDGWEMDASTNINQAFPYVAWAWDAGSSNATNTDGSITSTVRANVSAGISIISYTGTGTAGTIGHGLGVTPGMVIVKGRGSTGTSDAWATYMTGASATAGDYLLLEKTSAVATSSVVFNSTNPTSSVFSVGTWDGTNKSGVAFISYAFAPVSGFSAFGKYTGNGSAADGPFVFTSHRPRWILLKRTDTTSNWTIIDTAREGYNVDNDPLYPNLTNAEGTTDLADILSNGFKIRSADASVNANAGTYIYASFAESPFQYSRAR